MQLVLAVVSQEAQGTYGYKITQDVRKGIDVGVHAISGFETPFKDGCLISDDRQFDGRNRRYYSITDHGKRNFRCTKKSGRSCSDKVNAIFLGGNLRNKKLYRSGTNKMLLRCMWWNRLIF